MDLLHNLGRESLSSRILITGSNGLVGSSVIEELRAQGYTQLIPLTRTLCDLTNYEAVKSYFCLTKPDIVIHAAATVYGIAGNDKHQGSIFTDNILMNTHVIESCRLCNAKKIVAMGTIAAYPDPKITPVKEEQIWDGPPHSSESSYGHAKRAMLAQLLAYRERYGLEFAYVISTNLFGPNDKFDSQYGHVIPSLVFKFYEAKKKSSDVIIWGDGSASRDFLYVKDMARALILIMNRYVGPINVASGKKTSIQYVVSLLSNYFQMENKIHWDKQMPNGRQFYEIDLSRLASLGYRPAYAMEQALIETLDWFVLNIEKNQIRF